MTKIKEATVLTVEELAKTTSSELAKLLIDNPTYWIIGTTVGVDRKVVRRIKTN